MYRLLSYPLRSLISCVVVVVTTIHKTWSHYSRLKSLYYFTSTVYEFCFVLFFYKPLTFVFMKDERFCNYHHFDFHCLKIKNQMQLPAYKNVLKACL